jgi:phosphoribosylformylglycinamidine synthase
MLVSEQIALIYCSKDGDVKDQFNPNGSIKSIAGIFNKKKNILGMMPHPERMIDPVLSGDDGSSFFKDLITRY